MEKRIERLVETNEKLLEAIDILTKALERAEKKNALLGEQVRLLTHKRFGASSEKTSSNQLSFFEGIEEEPFLKSKEPTIETITYKHRKKIGRREEQLDGLPIEEIHYEFSEDECVCTYCNQTLHDMGSDIRKEIKLIPTSCSSSSYSTQVCLSLV